MNGTNEIIEPIVVRGLKPEDMASVVALDAKNAGRRREEYFKVKLQQNLAETGIKVSLAAEIDGMFVGFLLARVFYGEFGAMEPVAVLEALDVHPDFQRRGIGAALLHQLRTNLGGLGVARVRTEVGWDNQSLLRFFYNSGFRPAQRFCLDLDLNLPVADPRDS